MNSRSKPQAPLSTYGAASAQAGVKRQIGPLIFVVKIGVTLGLFYWLAAKVDVNQLPAILELVPPGYIVLAAVAHFIVFLLGGIRWWLLLRPVGLRLPFRRVMPSYLLGVLFNNLLPTSVGGDVVRVVHLKIAGVDAQALVSATIVDRIIGLAALLCMAMLAVLLAPASSHMTSLTMTLAVLSAVTAAGVYLLFAPFTARVIELLGQRFAHTRIRRWLLEVVQLCHACASAWPRIVGAFLLSMLLQSVLIMVYYLLARALNIQVPVIVLFALIPLVFIAASLPISVGGLGVREATLVALLSLVGVPAQSTIALSLLYLLVLIAASLPGALVLWWARAVADPAADKP